MAAKDKAAPEAAAEIPDEEAKARPLAPVGVPVVALINIYTPDRDEPAAPGEVVLVSDTDEAMALIARGHARAPTDGETLPAE